MAKDVPTLKAVSQNLMHENLSITDGVYGILSEIAVRERIGKLGGNDLSEIRGNVEQLITILSRVLKEHGIREDSEAQAGQ